MMEGDEYIQASKGKNVESFTCSDPQAPHESVPQNTKKKKSKMENKRRFSDEQIRSLECIFESESKLEPRKKIQLARDLGLQPRQVAIWFQNRRARWKSKRIEHDYRKLRDEYDNLETRFESLKKEKESLQSELQKLSELLVTSQSQDERREGKITKGHRTDDGGSGSGRSAYSNRRGEVKPSFSNEGVEDIAALHYSDDQKSIKGEQSHEDRGHQLLRMDDDDDEHLEIPLASLEKWYSEDPSGTLDQSCSSSQWLDFWI